MNRLNLIPCHSIIPYCMLCSACVYVFVYVVHVLRLHVLAWLKPKPLLARFSPHYCVLRSARENMASSAPASSSFVAVPSMFVSGLSVVHPVTHAHADANHANHHVVLDHQSSVIQGYGEGNAADSVVVPGLGPTLACSTPESHEDAPDSPRMPVRVPVPGGGVPALVVNPGSPARLSLGGYPVSGSMHGGISMDEVGVARAHGMLGAQGLSVEVPVGG